ncbi:MAG: putative Ig domain-containing protein, partial [Kiritimatiellae bacterium]|nr:putative Ig domain-containing protein [Kiritimatiellia bacterium]
TASAFAGEKNAVGLFAEDRIASMNNILANSGLAEKFSFRLVGTIAVSTDARTVRSVYGSADLDAITDYLAGAKTDSNSTRAADWKRVRSKRKAVGADLVTFLVKSAEQGLVGIGFALDDSSISKAAFPDYAYNACAVSVAAYDCTIAHECGHNMGAGHAKMRDADSSGPQLYDYSTGHYFDVTNAEGVVVDHCTTVMGYNNDGRSSEHAKAWREYAMSHYVTINGRRMRLIDSAYYDSNWTDGEYRETSHFSSPSVGCLYDDPVVGVTVASGVPTGTVSHDNARLLGLTYPLVANYRLHKDALLVSCSGSGSVEGGGLYVPGKRVKLVATPKKGYVFCGWYADAKMRSPLPGLWQARTYSYTVPAGGATVYAKFRKKTSEAAQKLSAETDADFYVLTPGEAQTIPLNVEAGCLPVVSASNLPDGMALKRLANGSWVIAGTPTARGEWTVSLSVSTAARQEGVVVAFDVLVGEWNGPTPAEVSLRMRTGNGAYETIAADSTNEMTVGVKQRLVLRCDDMADEADPYKVEGLPPGLSCAGGVISGVPTASGLYNVRVTARKAWKWD